MTAGPVLRTSLAAIAMALVTPGAFAQDVISGKFYRYQIVGRAGVAGMTTVLAFGPSINNKGQVAFAGQVAPNNAVWVADLGTDPPRKIAQQNQFSFLGGIQINEEQHLVALEQSSIPEPDGFRKAYLWDYDATPPAPYARSLIVGAIDPTANDFKQLRFEATLNNAGEAAFSGLRVPPNQTINALGTGVHPVVNRVDLLHPLRPMVADNGAVVVRAGSSPSSPIRIYSYDFTATTIIADANMGFSAVGQSPGISDDGSVVVFYGLLTPTGAAALGTTPGPGIFASVDIGGGAPRRILRLARRLPENDFPGPGENDGNNDGVCDPGEICLPGGGELGFDLNNNPIDFASFSADTRIGVTQFEAGVAGVRDDTIVVTFIATPTAESAPPAYFSVQPGIWSEAVAIKDLGAGVIVAKPSRILPVIQSGDSIGGRIVSTFQIYDPIAGATRDENGAMRTQRAGDHRIAFYANASGGPIVVRASHLDSDEDGLLDHWETTGIDFDGNGVVDLPLHAATFLARPDRKDIFVEIDYMNVPGGHTHRPGSFGLSRVQAAFKMAPVDAPDGITLHLMRDEALPEVTPIRFSTRGPGTADDFDDLKFGNPVRLCTPGAPSPVATAGHLGAFAERTLPNCNAILGARRISFHYMIFGHTLVSPPGVAPAGGQGELPGNDFISTLGPVPVTLALLNPLTVVGCQASETLASCIQRLAEESAIMHELGHNLGLRHGGGDHTNCKPNYLSVMSYTFIYPDVDRNRKLDYSRETLPPLAPNELIESSLNETLGISGPAGRTTVYGLHGGVRPPVPANGPIDWNGMGGIQPLVSADINFMTDLGCPASPGQTLRGFNDWPNLKYTFSSASSFSDGIHVPPPSSGPSEEFPLEAIFIAGAVIDPDVDGVVSNLDNCPGVINPSQTDGDGDGFGDACDPGNTLPPTVSITAPANGAQFPGGSNVTISATASDPDGTIVTVEFYAGATLIGDDDTAPYSIVWNNVRPGSYALTAVATDNNSSSTTSAPVNVIVTGPTAVVSGNAAICRGGSATIQAALTSTPPWNLTWSDGLVQMGVTANPATRPVNPATTTTYTLIGLSNGAGAGSASGQAVITVTPRPTPVINTPDDYVPPAMAGLVASTPQVSGSTYAWLLESNGGSITTGNGTSQITFTSGVPGNTMTLHVTETNAGCSSEMASRRVQVDFLDVDAQHPYRRFVGRVAGNGVTTGCGNGTYCPDNSVLRSEMAVFLLLSEEGSTYQPPTATGAFCDVPYDNPFAKWIEELARRGVTGGCGAAACPSHVNYCPSNAVTRDQMAVFLLVTRFGTDYLPPACEPPNLFDDVPETSPYCRWIEDLARRDIVGGCGTRLYCPLRVVTRGEMAVFLVGTFGLPFP